MKHLNSHTFCIVIICFLCVVSLCCYACNLIYKDGLTIARAKDKMYKMRGIHLLLCNYSECSTFISPTNNIWIEGFYSDYMPPENSWRFKCSGYLGSGNDPEYTSENVCNMNKPWYVMPNKTLRSEDFCWVRNDIEDESRYWTNVMAITGSGTAHDLRYATMLKDCNELIVLIEINNSEVHWAKDQDISIESFKEYFECRRKNGSIALVFLDGTIWIVNDDIPFKTLLPFFSSPEVKKHKRDIEICPYLIVGGNVIGDKFCEVYKTKSNKWGKQYEQ